MSSLPPCSCNHNVLRNEGLREAGRFCLSLQTLGSQMTSESGKRTSLSAMEKTCFSLIKPVPWPYLPGFSFLIVLNEKKSSCPESASNSQCFLPMSTAEKLGQKWTRVENVTTSLLLDVIDRHIEKDFGNSVQVITEKQNWGSHKEGKGNRNRNWWIMSRTEVKIFREHPSHLIKRKLVKLVCNFKLEGYPEWTQKQEEPTFNQQLLSPLCDIKHTCIITNRNTFLILFY